MSELGTSHMGTLTAATYGYVIGSATERGDVVMACFSAVAFAATWFLSSEALKNSKYNVPIVHKAGWWFMLLLVLSMLIVVCGRE